MSDDEAELTRAAAAGDHEAFRVLVDRYYDAALRYAVRMLGERPDGEDAVQETFIRAYRALPRYRHDSRFRPWLFRILVNRCRTAARHRKRRAVSVVSSHGLPESALGVEEPPQVAPHRRRAIEEAVAALPTRIREAFLLKVVDEWTYDEMAEITGANVSALKMRVSRARVALRSLLEEVRDD